MKWVERGLLGLIDGVAWVIDGLASVIAWLLQ